MISVRQLAGCLLLPPSYDVEVWAGDLSVVQDLFGYVAPPFSPPLSLLELARSLTLKRVDVNLIRVGSEMFTFDDEQKIDAAVGLMRFFYATVGLCIGRVSHYWIPFDEADWHDVIDDDAEAMTLTEEWSFPDDALDVFLVRLYVGDTVGRSAVNGSCDKNLKDRMTGSVVSVELDAFLTGITLAHEVGHYLGLEHRTNNPANLMFPDVGDSAGLLTAKEGERMKKHCMVYTGCRWPS